jgi:hypothetical protein
MPEHCGRAGNCWHPAAAMVSVAGPARMPPGTAVPPQRPIMKSISIALVSAASLAFASCDVQGPRAGDSHLNDGNRTNDGKMMSASDRVALDQSDQGRVNSAAAVKR